MQEVIIIIDLKDIHFEISSFFFCFLFAPPIVSLFATRWCPLMCVIILLKCIFLFNAHSNSKLSDFETNCVPKTLYIVFSAIAAAAATENIMHIKFKLMIWWVLYVLLPAATMFKYAVNELHRPWINRVNVIPPRQTSKRMNRPNEMLCDWSFHWPMPRRQTMFYTEIPWHAIEYV